MSVRNLFSIFTILTLAAGAGCSSESTTDPGDGGGNGSLNGVAISYEADAAAAVTGDITPGAGGDLTATATDGVVYRLTVPANAVASTLTVTMTPLASLTITDTRAAIGAARAAAPSASDCRKGVILEPLRIDFDLPAVLTMIFPGACDLDADDRIVYFEPSWNSYEIVSTTLDDGANKLTCSISHFSVFGTDAPSQGRLQGLIAAAKAAGLADPGEEALAQLASYFEEAEARNWDDLANECRTGIEAVVRAVASEGYQQCSQGNKEQGRELLNLALDWIGGGWVSDPGFGDDVEEWLVSCDDITATLTATRDWITDIALSKSSTATFTDFEATVYSSGGTPLEGQSVGLQMTRISDGHNERFWSGDSDASGKVRFRYAYGKALQNSILPGRFKFTVWVSGKPLAEVDVQLARVQIGLLFDYAYSYDLEVPNVMYRHTSASFELGGQRNTQVQDCSWSRTYSMNHWDGYKTTEVILLPVSSHICIYDIKTVTHQLDDEYRTPVAVLSGVEVSLRGAAQGRTRTTVTYPDAHQEISEADVDMRNAFGTAYPPGEAITVDYFEGTGMFDTFGFSGDTADGHGSGGCTITVWVLPVFPPTD